MLRIPTVATLAPRVAARKMANSRSVKRVARSAAPAATFAKSSLNSLNLPFYRLYSTPATEGATAAASASTTSISAGTKGNVATSATAAAATAGTGFWSKLFFATKYSSMAPGFWTYVSAPMYGLATLLEAAQVTTGLPWWAVIASTAIVLRIGLTPLVITQMKTAVIMERLQPKIQKLRSDMMAEMARMQAAGQQASTLAFAGEMQGRMNELMKAEGVGPMQAIKMMFIQMIPMALFFITLNRMASPEMGFEALKTGGMLWFTDLSAADPYYIFPSFAIVTMFISLFLNPSPRPPSTTTKVIFGVLGLFSFWITSGFPTAVHMYWAAVNVMTILTMGILRIPSVRKRMGIPLPLADSVKSEHNQLFDRPPTPPAAAAPAQAAAPPPPRPTSKRQQRLQQQAEKNK